MADRMRELVDTLNHAIYAYYTLAGAHYGRPGI